MQRGTLLASIAACALLLPLATSQNIGPAVQKVGAEKDAATADPGGYARHETSEGGIAAERAWTTTYACESLRETSHKAGIPPPDLEACRPGPSVDAGPEPTAEPVGEVVPVTADAVGEAEHLADDGLGAADAILHDPPSAFDRIVGFLSEALTATGRLLDDVLHAVDGVLGGVGDATMEFAASATGIVGSLVETTAAAAATVADGARLSNQALMDTTLAIGQGASEANAALVGALAQTASATMQFNERLVRAVGDAATTAVGGVGHAATATSDAVGRSVAAVQDWLANLTRSPTPSAPTSTDDAKDVVGKASDALRPVKDVIGRAIPT